MTLFQLMMLGASAYFAFKIYEHIQTLEEPKNRGVNNTSKPTKQTTEAFSPFEANELQEKADEAFEQNDEVKALAFLQEASVKEDSNNPDTLYKIGYILQNQDNYDDALTYYKKALELDKNNEYIRNSLASIYRHNKEYVSAQMHLRESLAINDENAVTYYNYGNLLVDMDSKEEAINMYKKALELDPEFEQAKEELEKLNETK